MDLFMAQGTQRNTVGPFSPVEGRQRLGYDFMQDVGGPSTDDTLISVQP